MLYSNLNNLTQKIEGIESLELFLSRFAEIFYKENNSFLTSLYANEYFGKKNKVNNNYNTLNDLMTLMLSLIFIEEQIDISEDDIKVSEILEEYSINCLKKSIYCNGNIQTIKLIEALDEALANDEGEISIPDIIHGIGFMRIGNTFKIK